MHTDQHYARIDVANAPLPGLDRMPTATASHLPRIVAADVRFPERYERQMDLARWYQRVAGGRGEATNECIERFFARTGVQGRHFVLPREAYADLGGFGERSAL